MKNMQAYIYIGKVLS